MTQAKELWAWEGGSLCIDFLNTVRDRAVGPRDTLTSPRLLGAWCEGAGIPVAHTPTDADLELAIRLRDAVEEFLVPDHTKLSRQPSAAALLVVNDMAQRAPRERLGLADGLVIVEEERLTPASALSLIAASAVELVKRGDLARLRECSHANCGLRYVDRSRAGRRRWCSMQRCGNRVKVARHARAMTD